MPSAPAYVPSPHFLGIVNSGFVVDITDMELATSLSKRVQNVMGSFGAKYFFGSLIKGCQRALDEKFPDNSPSLPASSLSPFKVQSLAMKGSLVFTNAEPLLDFPHPTLSKVVDVGGIAVPKPKPLNEVSIGCKKLQKWKRIVTKRKQNVLISFGSLAKSSLMPEPMKGNILNVVKEFPHVTFIWKYEKEDDFGRGVENLVKTKWMPQNDLVREPCISFPKT